MFAPLTTVCDNMNTSCGICSRTIGYSTDIRCSSCSNVFHMNCVPTETGEIAASTKWKCNKCTGPTSSSDLVLLAADHNAAAIHDEGEPYGQTGMRISNPSLSTTQSQMQAPFEALTNSNQFQLIMEQFKGIKAAIEANNANVASNNQLIREQKELLLGCIDTIETLKVENTELRQRVSELEMRVQDMSSNYTVEEVRDRIQRDCNIVVSGLKETTEAEDDTAVKKMLDSIARLPANNILSVERVGKVEAGRDRLLLVRLRDRQDKIMILQNKSKLATVGLPNIFIRSDLTRIQRQRLDGLRREIEEGRKNGERNLYIGYRRGEPTILKGSNRKTSKRSREEDDSPKRPQGLKAPNVATSRGPTSL